MKVNLPIPIQGLRRVCGFGNSIFLLRRTAALRQIFEFADDESRPSRANRCHFAKIHVTYDDWSSVSTLRYSRQREDLKDLQLQKACM